MDSMVVLTVFKQGFYTAFLIAAPILLVSLVVGVLISIFQAATSISDATLNFAPKVLAAGVTLILLLPWMINKVVALLTGLVENIPSLIK